MDYDQHIDAVEQSLAGAVAAIAAGPPDARVPTCPDFSLDQLAEHLGTFSGFWTHVLCEGTGRDKPPVTTKGVEPSDRAEWLADIGAHLVVELLATPPDTTVWTWHPPDQTAAFVARRTCHELAVHRVDVQLARGSAEPVGAAVAADGIEEIFVLLHRGGPDGAPGTHGAGQTMHLHGTDFEPAEWLLTLAPDGVQVERVHAKGDLALRGSVSDLEMLLYQRPPVGEVTRFGDESVLDVFHGEFTFG